MQYLKKLKFLEEYFDMFSQFHVATPQKSISFWKVKFIQNSFSLPKGVNQMSNNDN